MSDFEPSQRYARHVSMAEFGVEGQAGIRKGRVLIIGLGGLGSPAAMYLTSSGVGELTLCDDDHVDIGNLQRQLLHQTSDIGRAKTESAKNSLTALNPETNIVLVNQRLHGRQLDAAVAKVDVVLDASDNFASRFALNEACVKTRTPLISGAAIGMSGQFAVFRPDLDDSPCYACLYPPRSNDNTPDNCSSSGVLAPLTGIIGSMMACETLKLLSGFWHSFYGQLLTIDTTTMALRSSTIRRDPDCPVCRQSAIPKQKTTAPLAAQTDLH